MRIKGAVSSQEFLNRHGNGSAVVRPETAPLTALQPRPTTEEEKLNKLETAWLQVLRNRGHDFIGVQDFTLKLGFDCRFTPDFWVLESGGIIFYDTKGFQREDALVKIKTAARRYTLFRFVIVRRDNNGEWSEVEVKP